MSTSFLEKFKRTFKIALALAKTNFSLRIEGSYLGIAWYLLNPLALFLIIILIKNNITGDFSIKNYEIYLLIGIISFNFFKQTLANSITTISANINYLKSINNINPETLVMSGLITSLMSHFFDLVLIVIFMLLYNISLVGLLLYPLVLLFFIIMLLGFSFIFATLGVYIKDYTNVWSIITQLLFFLTPIFYTITEKDYLHYFNLLNPLFYFLTIVRSLLIDFSLPSPSIIITFITTSLFSFIFGLFIFNKYKKKFAEQ